MTENAVKAFAKGNVTLGGELGCALGPHGRTAEADIAVRSVAPVFTYSFSRYMIGLSCALIMALCILELIFYNAT